MNIIGPFLIDLAPKMVKYFIYKLMKNRVTQSSTMETLIRFLFKSVKSPLMPFFVYNLQIVEM